MVDAKQIPNETAEEHRDGTRQRVLLSGRIVHSPQEFTVDCAIDSLSESGARVRLRSTEPIVDPIYLIHLRYGLAYKVRIVWRRDQQLACAFTERFDLSEPAPNCPKVLKRLWKQIAPARS